MFAAAGGHANCTKQLMDLDSNVHAVAIAKPGYREKLKKMVEDGIVPAEEEEVDAVTALHVAAGSGHLEVVKLLIEAGVDVSIEDTEQKTPLKMAIKGNHGDVATALVEAGADPNTEYIDEAGTSHNLLMDAIIIENVEFAKLLIQKGAGIYYSDDQNVSTLLQASHRGMTEVVELLLSKHDPEKEPGYREQASVDGVSPFIAAASEGHLEIVKALLKAGADVNARDKDGTTAIMAASAREVTRKLSKHCWKPRQT